MLIPWLWGGVCRRCFCRSSEVLSDRSCQWCVVVMRKRRGGNAEVSRRLLNSDFSLSRCQHILLVESSWLTGAVISPFFRQGVLGKSLLANWINQRWFIFLFLFRKLEFSLSLISLSLSLLHVCLTSHTSPLYTPNPLNNGSSSSCPHWLLPLFVRPWSTLCDGAKRVELGGV